MILDEAEHNIHNKREIPKYYSDHNRNRNRNTTFTFRSSWIAKDSPQFQLQLLVLYNKKGLSAMERSSATLSKALLQSLCHHVALPDRLPNGKEGNLEEIENKLTDLALQACFDLSISTEDDRLGSIWEKVAISIHTARLVNEGGKLESRSLLQAFRELDRDQALILHVVEQNAGLIIRHIQR
jgi:hypothetical protein